ncbi:MAG: glycosyltransferase family 2 protein [Ignavibacteriae bacterium]|nr:glycosyltransferase family 2 protein [Ignavibacteriota bacterium]
MKILIIVPAYNEEKNILKVIDSLNIQNPDWDILIVNDCSEDNTLKISELSGKANIINLCSNIGIGGTVQTGFKYAKNNNYDITVQFDGDGQHIANEIQKLLIPILNNESDIVIGSRFLIKHNGYKSTKYRRLGIKIFQLVNSVLINQKITDNTSGFRAYNKRALHFLSDYYPMDYPEPESVILLVKNGFKIMEVPAEMKKREEGKSSISGLKNFAYMIYVLLAILMNSIRPKILMENEYE